MNLPTQFRVRHRRLDRRSGNLAQCEFFFTAIDPTDIRVYVDELGNNQTGDVPEIRVVLDKLPGIPPSVTFDYFPSSVFLQEMMADFSERMNLFSNQFGLSGLTQFKYLAGDRARIKFLAPESGSEYNGIEVNVSILLPSNGIGNSGLAVDSTTQILSGGEDKFEEIVIPRSDVSDYKTIVPNLEPLGTYQVQVFADFPTESTKIFDQSIEAVGSWRSQLYGDQIGKALLSSYGVPNSPLFYYYLK